MALSISKANRKKLLSPLKKATASFHKIYPGDCPDRQPVHTLMYSASTSFNFRVKEEFGLKASNTLKEYAPNEKIFGEIFQLPTGLAKIIYKKIQQKLRTNPVEDFRVDFEDGFGNRSDKEEDDTAKYIAREMAKGVRANTLPAYTGIRIKPFVKETVNRGLRTLDIFVTTLVKESKGKLPDNFVVMLPKVSIPEQVSTLIGCFEILEEKLDLPKGSLKMDLMVETTQAVMAADGTNPLYRIIQASKGRCITVHFGTYDYTASCSITANYQEMNHPACDFAHHMTKVALAHTGIWLSDGGTNVMPIGHHTGKNLTYEQMTENRAVVHGAWKKGYAHIRHSLWHGFYQGWDLNPEQLIMRYAAVFAFFLESYEPAVQRIKSFIEKAGQANLSGDIFEDAATGKGLLTYFSRGYDSGALTEEDISKTGLTLEEIRSHSFKFILENRA